MCDGWGTVTLDCMLWFSRLLQLKMSESRSRCYRSDRNFPQTSSISWSHRWRSVTCVEKMAVTTLSVVHVPVVQSFIILDVLNFMNDLKVLLCSACFYFITAIYVSYKTQYVIILSVCSRPWKCRCWFLCSKIMEIGVEGPWKTTNLI